MLSFSVDAEEGDEGAIFDRLADVIDDPKPGGPAWTRPRGREK